MSAHRILLIGGTGTVGGSVASQLAEHHDVRALAHSARSASWLREEGIADVVSGDVLDPACVASAMRDVDQLFLLAPFSEQQGQAEVAALEAAQSAGVSRIVLLSSVVAGRNIAISAGHEAAEAAARQLDDVEVAILRPENFMQNELRAMGSLVGGRIVAPTGQARAAFVDTRDIADVAVSLLTRPGDIAGTYVVTGPDCLTWSDYAARLGFGLGWPVEHESPDDDEYYRSAVDAGVPPFYAAARTEMHASNRRQGQSSDGPTRVVEDVTGHPPRPLETFVTEVLRPALARFTA